MPCSVKVAVHLAFTFRLSPVKPKRFWDSTCSGVSLMYVTVASATFGTAFCLIVRTSAAAGSAGAMPTATSSATTTATYRRIVDVRMESPLIVRLPRASKGAATAPSEHGLRPGWRRLLRRRNAERRVAGAARLPAEVLHHDLGGRRVLGASRVTQLHRPLPHVLCRGVELGPL